MYWTKMITGVAWSRLVGTVAIVTVFLIAAGCSSSGSKGGCGGGCCRSGDGPEQSPVLGNSPTVAAPVGNYGGQRTCPVTGEELGSMGKPIPVSVQGQTIYVCCEGCVAKVRQNPDAYLAKVQAEQGKR